jgi:hypothetical protein
MSVQLGGLWVNKDSQGNSYLSGNFGGFARIRVVKSKFKENDSQPDYIIYVDNKPKDTGEAKEYNFEE